MYMLNEPRERSIEKLLANIHQNKMPTASTVGKCLDIFLFIFCKIILGKTYS